MKRKRDGLYNRLLRLISGGFSSLCGKNFRIDFSKGNSAPLFSDTVL